MAAAGFHLFQHALSACLASALPCRRDVLNPPKPKEGPAPAKKAAAPAGGLLGGLFTTRQAAPVVEEVEEEEVEEVAPAPAKKAAKPAGAGIFGFGRKPAPVVEEEVVEEEVEEEEEVLVEQKAPAKKPAFGFFGGFGKPAAKPAEEEEVEEVEEEAVPAPPPPPAKQPAKAFAFGRKAAPVKEVRAFSVVALPMLAGHWRAELWRAERHVPVYSVAGCTEPQTCCVRAFDVPAVAEARSLAAATAAAPSR